MGLKVEEVPSQDVNKIERFFTESSINEFREFFPVEMAKFATTHFKKEEYFLAARENDTLVGAMHFSIQGGVGQLAAIQIDKELDPVQRERIRTKLFQRFLEICKEKSCHLFLVWIPYQCKEAIGVYLKQGFERAFNAKNFWYKNNFILLTKEL